LLELAYVQYGIYFLGNEKVYTLPDIELYMTTHLIGILLQPIQLCIIMYVIAHIMSMNLKYIRFFQFQAD